MGPVQSRWLSVAVVVAFSLLTPVSHAADPVAEALFRDAIELMKAGEFAQACPKLEASQAREARSGTLMVLASCHEQLGKTATAWAEYTDAATLAGTEGREENVTKARELAASIAPTLSTLIIDVTVATHGLTVHLDGAPVAEATFGTPLPVDQGAHTVTASAPGYHDWIKTITVGGDADKQRVTIPPLEQVAEPIPAPAPAFVPPPPTPLPPPAQPDVADEGGIPAWAWVVGGTGVALVIVAAVFRVDQSSAGSALDDNCGEDRLNCPADYDFAADRDREERSFGLFVGFGAVGVAAIVTGLVGILTAPSSRTSASVRATPWFSADAAGLGLAGQF